MELNEIQIELDKLHISPAFLDRNYRSVMFIRQIIQSILALVLGLPFFIYGIVHNGIPYKFVDHTHADSFIAISNSLNGEKIIKKIFFKIYFN